MKNIVVLVSGGGTNLQALIDAEQRLERAEKAGIPHRVVERKAYPDRESYSQAILDALNEEKADLVILAGFMVILDERVPKAYQNRILNVHPALIPSFCGPGFYGLKVHEAALAAGVKLTGATVHFVSEVCDGGPIILQGAVPVENDDTPETLQKRVMEEVEWKLLPKAAALFCQGKNHRGKRHCQGARITAGEFHTPSSVGARIARLRIR